MPGRHDKPIGESGPLFPINGAKVRELRKKKNLGVRELGEMIGQSGSYISQIEHGVIKKVSVKYLARLVLYLDAEDIDTLSK